MDPRRNRGCWLGRPQRINATASNLCALWWYCGGPEARDTPFYRGVDHGQGHFPWAHHALALPLFRGTGWGHDPLTDSIADHCNNH